jgi:hypothetical protein
MPIARCFAIRISSAAYRLDGHNRRSQSLGKQFAAGVE